ncbi:hypothetical protein NM688_g1531 [Phlebia brevispora]|uniref:Uncharacterized protein n=1 Tax=Phlebia brevispora TaxID=194682 RepID=A0ACC1TBV6_9APHY|nr:hypothetical protein NM688_g1531 [Phlebia brevispora]
MALFPPAGIPSQGELLLITDELSSPADFLLHRLTASHLKGGSEKAARAVVLTVSENVAKWKTIAAKANINLTQLIDSRSVVFLDVVSRIPLLPNIAANTIGVLKPIIDDLDSLLNEEPSKSSSTLVILDDISSLEWMGVPTQDLQRFARALAALCRKLNAALAIRHHIVTPGEPDDLLRLLLQICTYHIDVLPLSTGRSGAVSGQIALHPGPGQILRNCKPISRSAALQYKLTDSGCVFFERGTSSGVL